ncbi:MAG: 30S ribosomal protein S17 [Dehalococcoidia bacterium]|nr:30S ribosomal protein S17 [Dehalococcoidia bacterium]
MEKNRKVRFGKVTSNKMAKTVVVQVESLRRHPLYHKVVKQSSTFKVHDEENACNVGDVVKIVETRPLSKDKRWRLVEIIRKADVVGALKDEVETGQSGEPK